MRLSDHLHERERVSAGAFACESATVGARESVDNNQHVGVYASLVRVHARRKCPEIPLTSLKREKLHYIHSRLTNNLCPAQSNF